VLYGVRMADDSHLRIGELSRRSGISPELLRQWERRYDLIHPTRSPGGLRLYSLDDLERVRLMARHIRDGVAAREAAALAARADLRRARDSETSGPPGTGPAVAFDSAAACAQLRRAVETFDEPAAQAVIDELLSVATLDAVLSDVLMPLLRDVGDRWQRGELSVAQEHFASNVLRGRLLGLARGWGGGTGPLALLACPPGEYHDLGLIAFGLALRARGWRIAFLGSDTPLESLVRASELVRPQLLVVSATAPELLERIRGELVDLASDRRVAVAGPGASAEPGDGLVVLRGDAVEEAVRIGAALHDAP
jgi:MerR family transcriptional regulator, light-induced transcriptional regulator